MQSFFFSLIGVSITISLVMVLLLLLSSYLNERYTVKWRYFIWMILAIRLILPVDFGLTPPPVELNFNDREIGIEAVRPGAAAENAVPASDANNADKNQNASLTSDDAGRNLSPDNTSPIPVTDPENDARGKALTVSRLAVTVWLVGAAAFTFWQFGIYLFFRHTARRWYREPSGGDIPEIFGRLRSEKGIVKPIRIKICRKIESPMITGLFRPALLLPCEEYQREDLEIILKHELTHFKRGDLWFKLLLLCANALHWFNPFMYIMVREANRDIEISCDEEVLKGADLSLRKRYGERILELTQGNMRQEVPVSTNFYGGKGMLKNRLRHIFDERKKKRGIILFCVILILVLMFSACRFDIGLNRWQIEGVSVGSADAYDLGGSGGRSPEMQDVDTRLSFDLDQDGVQETEFILSVTDQGRSSYLKHKGEHWRTIQTKVLKGVEPGAVYSLQAANLEDGASIMLLVSVNYRGMPFGSGSWELYIWNGAGFKQVDIKTLEENLQIRILEQSEIRDNTLNAGAEIWLYDRSLYPAGYPAAALYFKDGLNKGGDSALEEVYYAPMSDYDAEGFRTWGQEAINKIMTEMNFVESENVKGLADDPPPVILETKEIVFITLPNITAEVRQYYQYRDGIWTSVSGRIE